MPVFYPSQFFHGKQRKGWVWASIFILFSVLPAVAAQENPCFYIGSNQAAPAVRTCVGATVTLTECTNGGANLRYSYGDGVVYAPNAAPEDRLFTSATTHIYTKAGLYTVTQQGTFTDLNGKPGESGGELAKANYIEVLDTPDPGFTISPCANYAIRLKITDNVYENFTVNWGDGSPEETLARGNERTHAYTNTNQRTITVRGIHAGTDCGGNRLQAVSPVLSLIKPALKSLEVTDGGTAKLIFQAEANATYRIEKSDGNGSYSSVVPVFSSTTSGPFTQPLTDDFTKPITYRIVNFDECGNSIASDDISTIALNATATDGENRLAWQTNPVPTADQIQVLRDGKTVRTSADVTLATYRDSDVSCGNTYCYQVRIQLNNGAESLSNTACAKAVSGQAPAAVANFKATVTGETVLLTWDAPGGNSAVRDYVISRADTGGKYTVIAKVAPTANRYRDSSGRAGIANYCYRISYADNCGNQAAVSLDACPVRLQAAETGSSYALSWSAYGGWPDGVQSYEIEKLRADGGVSERESVAGDTTFAFPLDTVNQLLRFRVRAVGLGQTSESNIVEVRQTARIFLPDAFSPNGDGVNDFFRVKGLFIGKLQFAVYNRWGEVVYASSDINEGWDGKNNRYAATSNVYAYYVNIEDQLGRKVIKRGNVLLVR